MADLGPMDASGAAPGVGPLNRLARAQYRALAAMRARMFINSLRSSEGAFELGARAIAFFIYGLMGLGAGVGAGAAAYVMVLRHDWQLLPVEFWVVCFIWQAVAVALASFQEQYDLGALLRFPVNFGSFYLLFLLFGLIDVSTLMGGLCCLGILIGITLSHPELFGWTVLGLAGFAAFNILLVRAILAWIDRWIARRRSREIMSAIFLLSILCLQLFNPVLREGIQERSESIEAQTAARIGVPRQMRPWVKAGEAVQIWLPPGLTAVTFERAQERKQPAAIEAICILALYVLAAGGLLAVRLRAEYRGENLGESPRSQHEEKREPGWLINGAGPVSAVIEKELHTLMRSMPQLYALVVPMVMVFVIASLFRTSSSALHRPAQLALPVCVAYGLLGFIQLMYNNLGGEGKGIHLLFLFPVPVRTVLLAKNLFHALLFVLVALIAAVLASARLGRPGAIAMATTAGWLVFALPANLAAGNVLSLMMAYRANLGRIGRQSGSQANALLSMLIQTTLLGVGAGVISLCGFFSKLWLAAPVLLALAAVAILAWIEVLRNSDAIAHRRRDALLARLAKAE